MDQAKSTIRKNVVLENQETMRRKLIATKLQFKRMRMTRINSGSPLGPLYKWQKCWYNSIGIFHATPSGKNWIGQFFNGRGCQDSLAIPCNTKGAFMHLEAPTSRDWHIKIQCVQECREDCEKFHVWQAHEQKENANSLNWPLKIERSQPKKDNSLNKIASKSRSVEESYSCLVGLMI